MRAQKKIELVRVTFLCDPGDPGAKDVYVLPHEREPMSPMAENISSSVQTPGLSSTNRVVSRKFLNFLHFRFLIHKVNKTKAVRVLQGLSGSLNFWDGWAFWLESMSDIAGAWTVYAPVDH